MMFKKVLLAGLMSASLTAAYAGNAHPQDGLSADEIKQIRSLMIEKKLADDKTLYPLFEVVEPAKDAVYAWRDNNGPMPDRKALVQFRKGNKFYKTVVNLSKKTVAEAEQTKGQPMILLDEFFAAASSVLEHKDFIAGLAKRGLKPEQVNCIPLTAGNFGTPADNNKRLMKVPCFVIPEGPNFYSKPVEGLYGTVDLEKREVIEVVDTGVVPIPEDEWDYTEEGVAKRTDLRPKWNPSKLEQKGGPNFKVEGNKVTWDMWKFHFRIDKRPGLVLSDVQVNDGKKWRNYIYQMHLSEVFVPYMDPAKTWNYRTYMDSGEYGFGVFLSPLRRGVDCPKYAKFFPAVMNDDMGNPVEIPDAICLFERDTGNPSWRHFEVFQQGPDKFVPTEGRPETELVLRSASEVGNYDYLIDYRFKQNGDVSIKVGASGLDATKGVASKDADSETFDEDTRYGSLIAPNLVAANHDHYFNFRVDLDVDGRNNVAMKTKLVPFNANSKDNPRGPMWRVKNVMIDNELAGRMQFTSFKPQYFMMVNPNKHGPLKLHPGVMMHHTNVSYGPYDFVKDMAMRRNAYLEYTVWTTQYDPKHRYAGGEYALGSDGSDTLAEWVKADKDLRNKDIVAWFSTGFHHIPRTEDWPVMSTEWITVHLQPMNFFQHNPALTLRTPESESIKDTIAKGMEKKAQEDKPAEAKTEKKGD
ncbi:MAG: tyramine oxidase [Gammaproteobacteria bacterium]|nr:MAG: tyramine oxidase [Gammaproteobacteria bacterium]